MATAWYAYPVTQAYGQHGEKGVDLGTPFHTPVTALFAGTVRFAGRTQWSGGGSSGGEVTIVCNVPGLGPMTSYYLHLDTATVKPGDKVPQGAVIGLSGGQLSGGQWPVVNVGGFFSNGPHTEFGFNAPWVSGPGHPVDPTPYILAARAGTLPATTIDGSGSTLTLSSQGATPAAQVWTPTLVESVILQSFTVAATTHKTVTEPTGWDGMCQAIDYAEQFPEFNWLNPFGSVWADLPPLLIRGLFFGIAFIIFWTVIIETIRQPVGAVLSTLPLVGGIGKVIQNGGASDSAAAGMMAQANTAPAPEPLATPPPVPAV